MKKLIRFAFRAITVTDTKFMHKNTQFNKQNIDAHGCDQLIRDRKHPKQTFLEQARRIDVLNEYYLVHSIAAPEGKT